MRLQLCTATLRQLKIVTSSSPSCNRFHALHVDLSYMFMQGHPEMRKANEKLPTFLYVMPFGPNKIFLEETSLVSRPPFAFNELKERLEVR